MPPPKKPKKHKVGHKKLDKGITRVKYQGVTYRVLDEYGDGVTIIPIEPDFDALRIVWFVPKEKLQELTVV